MADLKIKIITSPSIDIPMDVKKTFEKKLTNGILKRQKVERGWQRKKAILIGSYSSILLNRRIKER